MQNQKKLYGKKTISTPSVILMKFHKYSVKKSLVYTGINCIRQPNLRDNASCSFRLLTFVFINHYNLLLPFNLS
jgi:hypothetical protein